MFTDFKNSVTVALSSKFAKVGLKIALRLNHVATLTGEISMFK